MKYLSRLFALSVVSASLSLSCNAGNKEHKNVELVNNLVKKLILPKTTQGTSTVPMVIKDEIIQGDFVQGDFNGDGIEDFAAIFMPVSGLTESGRLKIKKLWNYPGVVPSDKLHKSLVVFHGDKNGWETDSIQSYVLLDTSGALETPSFKLLISRTGDKSFKENASYLPVSLKSDFLILPTEAGIDTYIYWSKGAYNLFEPEEMP